MGRSIRSQLVYCLDETAKTGVSRRADRARGVDTGAATYSRARAETLRDRAKSFASYMATEHPEIRRARDIRPEHVQGYLTARGGQWSAATQREAASELRTIQRRVERVYGPTSDWLAGVTLPEREGAPVRDRAMERADLEHLEAAMAESRSAARDGLRVGAALGLRSCEVCGIRGRDIDIEHMTAHLSGSYTKGGRDRTVSISPEDRAALQALHDRYGDRQICPISPESYDRAMRRGLERIGAADSYKCTTQHAVRKLWARERYISYGGSLAVDPRHDAQSRAAWSKVQQELGHGSKYREELYRTYISGKGN